MPVVIHGLVAENDLAGVTESVLFVMNSAVLINHDFPSRSVFHIIV